MDESGRPLNPPKKQPSIGKELEALVKVELNSALDQLRERNREQFDDIRKEVAKKYRLLAAVLAALNVILGASLFGVVQWLPGYVRDKITEPKVNSTIDRIITDKSSVYVDNKLKPLEDSVAGTTEELNKVASDVRKKQKELEESQSVIREQVRIQQLASQAKGGDGDAWKELGKISAGSGELVAPARTAVKEVELFYDADRNQVAYPTWADIVSKQDPGFSADELMLRYFQNEDADREAIVNTLARTAGDHPESVIGFLCEAIEQEKNLRVKARITRALAQLSKQEFRPLDTDAVNAWWKLNEGEKYKSPYSEILDLSRFQRGERKFDLASPAPSFVSSPKDDNERQIELLEKIIAVDSRAFYARVVKAATLIDQSHLGPADDELRKVEKERPDYYQALFVRSIWHLKGGDKSKAVDSFESSP